MASRKQLPCNGDGICLLCNAKPKEEEKLACGMCSTPWHVSCLTIVPENVHSTPRWKCPDCTGKAAVKASADSSSSGATSGSVGLVAAIRAIEADSTLSDAEKAKKRQELLTGKTVSEDAEKEKEKEKAKEKGKGIMEYLEENVSCSFCLELPERPVSTPCGHNFCLTCFKKWTLQGHRQCANCRARIPHSMVVQPRINSGLVDSIRAARMAASNALTEPKSTPQFIHNQDKPDQAYTTERAKRAGISNAASGRIMVTVPSDHFGPILAENEPERNQGVLVGEGWNNRLECRQWGVHIPHVSGISGQSKHGAQSVVLSGGYQDDEDHGEWFLYTGSGGKDLSNNKRTNRHQSFDEVFENYNKDRNM